MISGPAITRAIPRNRYPPSPQPHTHTHTHQIPNAFIYQRHVPENAVMFNKQPRKPNTHTHTHTHTHAQNPNVLSKTHTWDCGHAFPSPPVEPAPVAGVTVRGPLPWGRQTTAASDWTVPDSSRKSAQGRQGTWCLNSAAAAINAQICCLVPFCFAVV